MSNLTRLQAVSSSLDTAINKAENLPDAGSGGSVETCTVSVTDNVYNISCIAYTTIENGQMISKYATPNRASITIECVRGTLVVFDSDSAAKDNLVGASELYRYMTLKSIYIEPNYSGNVVISYGKESFEPI